MNYSIHRNVQILIKLLKGHGIKTVIASPGTTNSAFVGSIQKDDYFKIYSAPDERSAAYMACGLAAENGKPVVLSCTGATASRNYVPGLTEAFYRQLPILAVTSSQPNRLIGHHIPQVTDRQSPMPDIAKISIQIGKVTTADEEWECNTKINMAILELTRHGGGPVHINLQTGYSTDYSVQTLPEERIIHRITLEDEFPVIPEGSVAIFVGNHTCWTDKLTQAVDSFCEKYNAVVLYDHTSNYTGKYGVLAALPCRQNKQKQNIDLLIHIGNVSGAYFGGLYPKQVWRVNPDGEIRDTFKKLTYIFEMDEGNFFQYYEQNGSEESCTDYYNQWLNSKNDLESKIPELPFSNLWIAQHTAPILPEKSAIHFGILNSLRSWNYFDLPHGVLGYCNTGGFGIDGCVSSLLGASLADPDKLYFGVIGDLAFFYDMNCIGNRHIGKNLRLLIVNNGIGAQFKVPGNPVYEAGFEDDANPFMAAEGHYGNKSHALVKHYAEDLGFEYLFAETKEQYLSLVKRFVTPEKMDRPIIFEVFTNYEDECNAALAVENLDISATTSLKQTVKKVLGKQGYNAVRKFLKR